MTDVVTGATGQEGMTGHPSSGSISAGGFSRVQGLSHGAMEGAQKVQGLLSLLLSRLGLPFKPEPVAQVTSTELMLEEAVRLQSVMIRTLENAHYALDPEPPAVQQKRVQTARSRRTTTVVAPPAKDDVGAGL